MDTFKRRKCGGVILRVARLSRFESLACPSSNAVVSIWTLFETWEPVPCRDISLRNQVLLGAASGESLIRATESALDQLEQSPHLVRNRKIPVIVAPDVLGEVERETIQADAPFAG